MSHTPGERGFDDGIFYLTGAEDYFTHEQKHGGCSARDLWRVNSTYQGPAYDARFFPEYSAYIFAREAVRAIENHAAAAHNIDINSNNYKPLFLYLPFQSIHSPLEVPDVYFNRYPAAERARCPRHDPLNEYKCLPSREYPGSDGKNCFCNRLIVRAQATAFDEAVGNITQALHSYGMWNNTVLALLGDNGGPTFEGHSNAPLRGGKLNFLEGGVRPAAFVSSPLLPEASRGTWYNGSVHQTDLFTTFLGLAGLPPPPGTDGIDMWPLLQDPERTASVGPPHRTEVLVADHILRSGDWKLITGGDGVHAVGTSANWDHSFLRDCMLFTDGGWLSPPTNATNLCPTDNYTRPSGDPKAHRLSCVDAKTEIDTWLCSVPCTPSHPCLFDLKHDPQERNNVAKDNPQVVAAMLARLAELNMTYISPTYPPDNGKFCDKVEERGGYVGPWLDG